MTRRLAILAAAAIAGLSAVVPLGAAANADAGGSGQIENVSASCHDVTLVVTYDWDDIGIDDSSSTYPSGATFETLVDGAVVDTVNADAYDSDTEHPARVPRARAAGPAAELIAAAPCDLDSSCDPLPCVTTTEFTKTVSQVLTPPKGTSSALALLGKLEVKAESHKVELQAEQVHALGRLERRPREHARRGAQERVEEEGDRQSSAHSEDRQVGLAPTTGKP